LGSELLKVTSQDTAVLLPTRYVVLVVVSVAVDEVPLSVAEYNCPVTADPP
jgi:hypothetical protein